MPVAKLTIRPAIFSEHKTIAAIAKQSKFTKDFTNQIFSSEECYQARRIRVAVRGSTIVGFTCFRHRVRVKPVATVLYFVTVDIGSQECGVGRQLVADLEQLAPSGLVELKVNKANIPAIAFYKRLGYAVEGEAYHGEGLVLRKARR